MCWSTWKLILAAVLCVCVAAAAGSDGVLENDARGQSTVADNAAQNTDLRAVDGDATIFPEEDNGLVVNDQPPSTAPSIDGADGTVTYLAEAAEAVALRERAAARLRSRTMPYAAVQGVGRRGVGGENPKALYRKLKQAQKSSTRTDDNHAAANNNNNNGTAAAEEEASTSFTRVYRKEARFFLVDARASQMVVNASNSGSGSNTPRIQPMLRWIGRVIPSAAVAHELGLWPVRTHAPVVDWLVDCLSTDVYQQWHVTGTLFGRDSFSFLRSIDC